MPTVDWNGFLIHGLLFPGKLESPDQWEDTEDPRHLLNGLKMRDAERWLKPDPNRPPEELWEEILYGELDYELD